MNAGAVFAVMVAVGVAGVVVWAMLEARKKAEEFKHGGTPYPAPGSSDRQDGIVPDDQHDRMS